MTRYAMVIDLQRCLGCYACVIACRQVRAVPPGTGWNRIEKYETGSYPNARITYVPIQCQQCRNPVCVHACPTGATYQRADGVVVVDPERCMGCRYCEAVCPYGARQFVQTLAGYWPDRGQTPYEKEGYQHYIRGTVTKCDFCSDRVAAGSPPACVSNCPGQARTFGDLDDPSSAVSRLLASRHSMRLLDELGTDPSVYYVV